MRWRQIVLSLIVGPFLFCLARIMYLDADFASRLPQTPDLATGRVQPMIIHHGMHVFASEMEIRAFHRAEMEVVWFGIAAVGAGGWYGSWRDKRRA